jgi:hypothetical protein
MEPEMKHKLKPKAKPKLEEYIYAIANPVTGMELVRSTWAYSLQEATRQTENIARCFGKSTEVVHVERA